MEQVSSVHNKREIEFPTRSSLRPLDRNTVLVSQQRSEHQENSENTQQR